MVSNPLDPKGVRKAVERRLDLGMNPRDFVRDVMRQCGASKVTVYRHIWRLKPSWKECTSQKRARSGSLRLTGKSKLLWEAAGRLSWEEIGTIERIKRLYVRFDPILEKLGHVRTRRMSKEQDFNRVRRELRTLGRALSRI